MVQGNFWCFQPARKTYTTPGHSWKAILGYPAPMDCTGYDWQADHSTSTITPLSTPYLHLTCDRESLVPSVLQLQCMVVLKVLQWFQFAMSQLTPKITTQVVFYLFKCHQQNIHTKYTHITNIHPIYCCQSVRIYEALPLVKFPVRVREYLHAIIIVLVGMNA